MAQYIRVWMTIPLSPYPLVASSHFTFSTKTLLQKEAVYHEYFVEPENLYKVDILAVFR